MPTDLNGALYTYDLADLGIVLNSTTVYIGVGWEPVDNADFFVCSDWDRSTVQPGYDMLDLDDNWESLNTFDPNYTALVVRGVFNDQFGTATDCKEDATTLCLQDNRFEVKVNWTKPNGETGPGMAQKLTSDTGYFWFFKDTNVEMVLKVLDNCSGNSNRFWVFAGGLTNVEVEITVTDTQTGAVRNYINPLRTPFQPIQDTNAFATCP